MADGGWHLTVANGQWRIANGQNKHCYIKKHQTSEIRHQGSNNYVTETYHTELCNY